MLSSLLSVHLYYRYARTSSPRSLSPEIESFLEGDARPTLDQHIENAIHLPLRDVFAIYGNSRLLVLRAQQTRVTDLVTKESTAMQEMIEEAHQRIQRTVILVTTERLLGWVLATRAPLYSIVLLDTYSTELVLVDAIISSGNDDDHLAEPARQ